MSEYSADDGRFTIQDVHEWFGCSREANKRVWLDSGFLDAMSRTAIKSYGQMLKTASKKSLYAFLEGTGFEHLSTAKFCAWEFQANLKQKHIEHKKDCIADFPNLPKFINYVKISVTGKMATAVKEHLRNTSPGLVKDENAITSKTPGTDNGSPEEDILFDADNDSGVRESSDASPGETSDLGSESLNGNDPNDGEHSNHAVGQSFVNVPFDEGSIPDNNPGSNLEQAMMRDEYMESARGLLAAFENWPELKGALKTFLHILRELAQGFDPDNLADLAVIAMITAGENHLFFKRKMKEYQKDAFNQNTWNANIRRLGTKWMAFLETEDGQRLYQNFYER